METKKIPESLIELLEQTSTMQEIYNEKGAELDELQTLIKRSDKSADIETEAQWLNNLWLVLESQIGASRTLPVKISEDLEYQIKKNSEILKQFNY